MFTNVAIIAIDNAIKPMNWAEAKPSSSLLAEPVALFFEDGPENMFCPINTIADYVVGVGVSVPPSGLKILSSSPPS
mgnify:CR=1 FL=1